MASDYSGSFDELLAGVKLSFFTQILAGKEDLLFQARATGFLKAQSLAIGAPLYSHSKTNI